MKCAIKDIDNEYGLMIRCPECNAWDRALEYSKPGIYTCDECGERFKLESE